VGHYSHYSPSATSAADATYQYELLITVGGDQSNPSVAVVTTDPFTVAVHPVNVTI